MGQEAADLCAVVQIVPVNGETAGLQPPRLGHFDSDSGHFGGHRRIRSNQMPPSGPSPWRGLKPMRIQK